MTESKVILVTGSSRGIGAALVESFAGLGWRVVINYAHSEELAFKIRDAIIKQHGKDAVLAIKADVGSRAEVVQMFNQVYDTYSRVDVLVNNEGINKDKPFMEVNDELWNSVINTILTGTFICSQEFVRHFRGEEGHIINIGADTAIRGRKNGTNYCSARGGVHTLTKCMAQELGPRIRVNCVTPGLVATEEVVERFRLNDKEVLEKTLATIPMARLGKTEDVFRLVKFLVCESSFITGQNFLVEGGKLML